MEIRLLETDSNRKGDVFTRLLGDYFAALGYTDFQFDVQKAGREVDVQGVHRTEQRRALRAECKAASAPIGGSDINKFVGVLDVERRRRQDEQVTGYFVALGGFKPTAVEQEVDAGNDRVVLVDGSEVVEELIRSRIIIPPSSATERAGRALAAGRHPLSLQVHENLTLLGHASGWLWLVSYGDGHHVSHFALIHADGAFASSHIVDEVLKSDKAQGGNLHALNLITDPDVTEQQHASLADALRKYRDFVKADCGYISLEGLPVSQDIASQKLHLEELYVPLHIERAHESNSLLSDDDEGAEDAPGTVRQPVDAVLKEETHIAVLGPPGSGKSTLVKHLALRYAQDAAGADAILPILIRCRRLGGLADGSITDAIFNTAALAELPDERIQLERLFLQSMRDGNAILLVDGLDEIQSDARRGNFVAQLRVFAATYPAVRLVLTSRERGFRIVAPAVASLCTQFRVSPLSGEEIAQLTHQWYSVVLAAEAATDEHEVVSAILASERVRTLAATPLLLTTLLLVKRWAGDFPRKRSALYDKAIEVLLMTWNVEGHDPLDLDEAVPQLAYLAYVLLASGDQRVSVTRLRAVLRAARIDMPDLLGYARISESDFVRRVEDRSSLLALSGHEAEGGKIVEVYEFRHLTFQEYLAAQAVVADYVPASAIGLSLMERLTPYIYDAAWEEVVPLACVLAGRRGIEIVDFLVDALLHQEDLDTRERAWSLLRQCLADEAMLAPDAARRSCATLVEHWPYDRTAAIHDLLSGKFARLLEESLDVAFLAPPRESDIPKLGALAVELGTFHAGATREPWSMEPVPIEPILEMLRSGDELTQIRGAGAAMLWAYRRSPDPPSIGGPEAGSPNTEKDSVRPEDVDEFYSSIPRLLDGGEVLRFLAVWTLAWIGTHGSWPYDRDLTHDMLIKVGEQWDRCVDSEHGRFYAWSISNMPASPRLLTNYGGSALQSLTRRFLPNLESTEGEALAEVEYVHRPTNFTLRGAISLGTHLGLLEGIKLQDYLEILRASEDVRGATTATWISGFDAYVEDA